MADGSNGRGAKLRCRSPRHGGVRIERTSGQASQGETPLLSREDCVALADLCCGEGSRDRAGAVHPELREALAAWRHTFNEERPHQSPQWLTPAEYRAQRLVPAPEWSAA